MAEQQPTIAELWQEFQKLFKIGKRNPLYWSKLWDKTNLRAQLLERCKKLHDSDGAAVEFSIYTERIEGGKTLIWAFADEHSLFLTKESAMNMSAAYAFMAWELDQRAKEVGNG